MNRELLQQCLDMINAAIKSGDWKVDGACDPDSLIRRLEAELAKPEQDKTQQALDKKADNARELGLDYEPVLCGCGDGIVADSGALCGICASLKPIREWVGLTDDERKKILKFNEESKIGVAFDIEAKLKEKNT